MVNLPYSEWSRREYAKILSGLVLPPGRHTVTTIAYIVAGLQAGRPVFPLNRARTGLRLALALFREIRPDADEIVLPAYICPSVVQTVEALGLRAVPADIGPDLNLTLPGLERAMTPRTLAVVAAHMYGCPAPITSIEIFCRAHGVCLIDDAAQVLGVSVDGRPLGSFGDAGVLSFSQSKTVVAGGNNAGGILTLSNIALERAAEEAWRALPEESSYRRDILHFLWHFKAGRFPRWLKRRTRVFAGIAPGEALPPTAAKMNSFVAALALEQIHSLPRRMAGRRRVADAYHVLLQKRPDIAFSQYAPGRYLTRVVLTLPSGTDVPALRAALARRGVETRSGYPVAFAHGPYDPLNARDIQSRLIELPSSSTMSEAEIETICGALVAVLPAPSARVHTALEEDRPGSRRSARHS
jgi:dTDP-4-amino-4,6-dideoxygalactose transaminase